MKASKFSDAQIAFVLKQAEDGTAIGEVCRQRRIRAAPSTTVDHEPAFIVGGVVDPGCPGQGSWREADRPGQLAVLRWLRDRVVPHIALEKPLAAHRSRSSVTIGFSTPY